MHAQVPLNDFARDGCDLPSALGLFYANFDGSPRSQVHAQGDGTGHVSVISGKNVLEFVIPTNQHPPVAAAYSLMLTGLRYARHNLIGKSVESVFAILGTSKLEKLDDGRDVVVYGADDTFLLWVIFYNGKVSVVNWQCHP